jgi:DNA-binding SARP family transcriptional activator
MEFRILGPLEVRLDGRPLPLGGPRQRALLAILLLHANEVVASDRLIEDLWGEARPDTAASALRVHMAQLRRALAADNGDARELVVTRAPGYLLRVDPDQIDAVRFERLAGSGARALAAGRLQEAADALREALALWRGSPLADFPYESFSQTEIARLEELRLTAMEHRIDADLACGGHADLVPELEALAAEHPLRERLSGQLMLALYRSGRQAEALESYRRTRRRLIDELGLDPSPPLQLLERGILLQDPSLELPRPARTGARVEGSTRPLTVLVADEATGDGDDVLDAVVGAVLGRGGRIESFRGDGVLATFGTPPASEDDPENAVLAALDIRERLACGGLAPGIGVSTGEVVLGPEGLASQRVVERADRLRRAAAVGELLVSPATHQLTRRAFEFSGVELECGPAFQVHRALPKPLKARGIEGLHAPLTGRAAELAALRAALGETVGGRGRVVVLGGDAGVGKSRLLHELRSSVEPAGAAWREGRCRASGTATSYLPFIELLGDHFGWVPEDDEREREQIIVSSVLERVRRGGLAEERVGEVVPLLANLLSVQRTTQPATSLDRVPPEQLRHRTFAAVRDFLVALARERPLVVVLEDFHWADELSLELASLLMETLVDVPLLLLCACRPDPVHRWRRLTSLAARKCGAAYRQLELGELTREQSLDLLGALLPEAQLPQRLTASILSSAQGNPFFLEEIVWSLLEAGTIFRASGAWQVSPDAPLMAVPESVQTVILSRTDRLTDDRRALLQTASVIGRSFPRRLLAHLDAAEEVEPALWELESRGLVFQDRVVPEEEFSFRHVLTQEAVYRSIPEALRTGLHDATARAIEEIYADALDERYEQLAYHFERGSDAAKAVHYLHRAGEKSRRAYLNDEAIDYFERALSRIAGRRHPLAGPIHEALGDLLELTGSHTEAVASYDRARSHVARADRLRRGRLHRKIAGCMQVQRRAREGLAALELAQAALGEPPDELGVEWWEERAAIELHRLWIHYFFGAAEVYSAAVVAGRPLVEAHGSMRQRCDLFALLGLDALRRDRLDTGDETVAWMRKGLAAAEESAELDAIAGARLELGFGLLFARRPAEALPELAGGLRLAERIGDVTLQARCLAYLSLSHRRLGNPDEVEALARRTIEISHVGRMGEYLAQAEAHLAWAALRHGDRRRAEGHLEAARPLWEPLWSSPHGLLGWIIGWPEIALALDHGRVADAGAQARLLLDPARHPMPDDLSAALESAVKALERRGEESAREPFERAAALAVRDGYL